MPNARIDGLNFSFSMAEAGRFWSTSFNDTEAEISGSRRMDGRGSLANGACSFTNTSTATNVKYSVNGTVIGSLPDYQEISVGTCEGIMSVADIKALDLSNITVCDDTLPESEESNCVMNQNMNHLTADL